MGPSIHILTANASTGYLCCSAVGWRRMRTMEAGACVSCGCCNKRPWTWWLQTTEIRSPDLLEAGRPKSLPQAEIKVLLPLASLPPPGSGRCRRSLAWGRIARPDPQGQVFKPLSASSVPLRPSVLCVPVLSLFPLLQRLFWLHLGPTGIIQDNLPLTRPSA